MATADKTVRCFKHSAPPGAACALPTGPAPSEPPAELVLRLTSKTSSLFHQGFPADVTAMECHGGLLAGGCRDGSVGLLCASLSATKAKFAPFASKHAAAVSQCLIRVSGTAPIAPQSHLDGPASADSPGAEMTACVLLPPNGTWRARLPGFNAIVLVHSV